MNTADAENEFRVGLKDLIERVERGLSPQAPDAYAGAGPQVVLEHTTRVYLLDGLVKLLGWTLGEQGDMAEEARLKGDATTFMDYLGVVEDARVPALLIEAKAWDKPFIRAAKPLIRAAKRPEFDGTDQLLAAAIDHVRDEDDTQPFPATDLWRGYIQQIAGYVRGLKEQHGHALPRAVLTSGQWMIIFTDPVRTFVDGPARADQFIILKKEAYLEQAALLFEQLSRANLGPTMPPAIRPGQIADYCPPNALLAVFRALHVRYEAIGSRLFVRHPKILVYRALILLRDDGAIIPVVEDVHRELSYQTGPGSAHSDLTPHLAEISAASNELVHRCEVAIGQALPDFPIDHFPGFPRGAVALGGDILPFVRPDSVEPDTWLVVTGTESHFLSAMPQTACQFHSWAACHAVSNAIADSAINTPRTKSPRSFFVDGEPHHCAHQGVQDLRHKRCHMAPIDGRLCCQACLYVSACWKPQDLPALACGS